MDKLKQVIEQKDSKHAAGIAYIVDDELLCVKSISGRWGIPKGHRHIDESPEDGAHREFTEETQIILNKPIELSHIGKKKNGGDFHVFTCQGDKKFVPRIGHEHIDWGYFRLFDLPNRNDENYMQYLNTVYKDLDNKGMNNPILVIEKENYWNRLPWTGKDGQLGVVTGSNRFRYAIDRGYTHIEGILCKNRGDWFPLWESTFVRVK